MSWQERVAPREPRVAFRTAVALSAAASLVTLVVARPSSLAQGIAIDTVAPLFLLLSAVLARHPERLPEATCCAYALAGVGAVYALDVITSDATFGGQVVLYYPTLYAASTLRPTAAWLVTAAACGADLALSLQLSTPAHAVADVGYFLVTALAFTSLLVRSGARQDALVAVLRRQAASDVLTGLANRRVLDEAAECALSGTDDGTVLVIVDLDRFKAVNDRHGHPVGDAVLRHVADVLSSSARAGDVASRLGGDEFALLLPGCSPEVGLRRADDIVAAVASSPVELPDGTLLPVSVSAGCAHAPTHARDLRALYAAADAALYEAKRAGRGRAALLPGHPGEDLAVGHEQPPVGVVGPAAPRG
ncbi:diguanylate cyclase (GGDEF)-like protein [Motilibacter rhizosphaerae]|uniref:Diguanylate cyclase (GGDEF)-like protein n=1 Tax=Motilibacter rhizosphaerae TaxID=598652 RepID=A0A4Q7NSF5_9ACTN|nr:GGDEF domain-containing protein [Motilibacter rhizosphaerae]RZS90063.1 diguanylate cyclase (GGDEF)-like protein [Motilibacter rhizosphaerae]